VLRRLSYGQVHALLAAALLVAIVVSACVGAFSYTPGQLLGFLAGRGDASAIDRNVFFTLRLPRVLLAALTGAVLGVSGTTMQGLFRNPIVEPGLVGTSAGAALGAALVFVLGGGALAFSAPLGTLAVPLAAFACGLAATMLVYRVSASFARVDVFTLLLAGVAVNAVCAAGTGFLSYVARDPQARNIVFWNLGTFTVADWRAVALVASAFALSAPWWLGAGRALNALMLGEDEATLLGFDTRRLVLTLLVVNTLIVAAATAMVGVIAFVGLVVPHLLRMLRSADYTFLLPASALLGALLMETMDVVARIVIPPAELPIGIITAAVGAPLFLWMLLRGRATRERALHG